MQRDGGLDRRTFLRHAGLTAVVGAVGPTLPAAALATRGGQPSGTYDFDTIYSRVGTDSSKWDAQIAKYGREQIDVGMGTAD